MHFWIDKRSQQCGFGRSRVAASLSHAGSGLSYGHPPRRSKPSSSHSAAASASSAAVAAASAQTLPSVHRSHQYQYGDGQASSSSRHYGNSNSNNNSSSLVQGSNSMSSQLNNNNGGHAAGTAAAVAAAIATTASNNNNAATTSSSAVLTGSGAIVPVATRSQYPHGARYQPRLQQQQPQQQMQPQQQPHHYSYHHPQFGNMAVRHYPSESHSYDQQSYRPQQQHSSVYADDAYSAYHSSSTRPSSAYAATPRRHCSSNMRHTVAVPATSTTTTMPATPAQTARGGNNLQQQHHALLQHADSQLLPSHLKCGMCASLVLATIFVGAAKFYFDHHGLEVLIFCAFSATFFLAACTVSLCRIPKGLLPARGEARAVCHSRVNATMPIGNNARTSSCLVGLEMNDVRYIDERSAAGQTATETTAGGPPPYHIAILLPEQTPSVLGKLPNLDESPPPSYDKILI